jgi:hypothetical protein
MFGAVVSIVYMALYLLSGLMIARYVFSTSRPVFRLMFAFVFALLELMWLPAMFAFMIGFTLMAQLLAALLCAMIGALFRYLSIKRKAALLRTPPQAERALFFTLFPLFILGFILFLTHTLKPLADGSLASGQSTYGDMNMHLGFITSISAQTTFPPQYSIMPGVPVGYPFLCDSVSSTFYTLGASLRFAYILPCLLAFASVLLGVYLFFEGWLKTTHKAVLATVLFFIGGGFGFAYFFDGAFGNPYNFTRIFTAFYQTPTNLVGNNIRWVNAIADMLIPQRATLFGWALLFPALSLLRRSTFEDHNDFVTLGVIAGAMPLVHTHSFVALAFISIVYFGYALVKRKNIKGFLIYAAIACALALPQLIFFTLRQSSSFLKFNLNWGNNGDEFFWFYIKNLGLIFILLPVAFIAAPKRDKMVYSGVLLLWAAAELIQFQPNEYDNNKLLFIWYAFNCGLVSAFLVDVYGRLRTLGGRRLLAGIVITAMTLSGVLTLGRELVSEYKLYSAGQVEAAEFIKANTDPDSTFLTAPNHNNAVSSLTGRNIVCGTSTVLYYHGFSTTQRYEDITNMFAEPEGYEPLFEKYSVDYIYVSYYERSEYGIYNGLFDFCGAPVFENEEVTIYQYPG